MKIRSILSGFAIFAAIAAYAATPYSLGLEDNLPEGTGFRPRHGMTMPNAGI